MFPSALIPCGYKFMPTNEELIGFYLLNKLMGALTPMEETLIPECDLYGEEEPWQIYERFGSQQQQLYGRGINDLYFFTKLKKRGSKCERSIGAGNGYWHGEDSAKKIVANLLGAVEGEKKRFRYKNKRSTQHDRWIMHEFSLVVSGSESDQWVLCRIRKKPKAKKRNLDAVD